MGMFGGQSPPGGPAPQSAQPTGYTGLTPDQIAMVKQQGYFMSPNAVLPNAPNGQPQQWQQPQGYSGLNPSQIQAVNQQGFYTDPNAVAPNRPDLWSRLMNAVGNPTAGQFRMPGTTIGAPAGQTPPQLPPAMPMPQGQMPTPPGANLLARPTVPLGAYFQNQQFPQGGGTNSQLMAQYMALQQMMQR